MGKKGMKGMSHMLKLGLESRLRLRFEVETDFPGSCTLLMLIVLFRREWADELTWP